MENINKKTNKRGFTLVELVVVIAILAILVAVAIPVVSSLVNKAKRSASMEQATSIQQAVAVCYAMDKSTLTSSVTLVTVGDAMKYFNINVSILSNGQYVYEPGKGKVYSILDNNRPAAATSVLTEDTPISNVASADGLLPTAT